MQYFFRFLSFQVGSTFVNVIRHEGFFRGLYAGAVPSLMANVGENAVLFVAYGQCQKMWARVLGKRSADDLNPLENAMAGSTAAFFSAMWLCPTEHIKCQLQVGDGHWTGMHGVSFQFVFLSWPRTFLECALGRLKAVSSSTCTYVYSTRKNDPEAMDHSLYATLGNGADNRHFLAKEITDTIPVPLAMILHPLFPRSAASSPSATRTSRCRARSS